MSQDFRLDKIGYINRNKSVIYIHGESVNENYTTSKCNYRAFTFR